MLASMFMAILLVSMTALPAISALPPVPHVRPQPGPEPAPSRAGVVIEDKMYFHRHAQLTPQLIMNTTITNNRQETVLTTSPIEFVSQTPLGSDVTVAGKDDRSGGSGKGMWLNFPLAVAGLLNPSVIITILQDNTTVANGTTTLSTPFRTEWSVPFANGESDHIFPAGSLIKVRISASRPATLTYNTTDSYLQLPLMSVPISSQLVTAFGSGTPTTEFHPYWPDSIRRIRAEGEIYTSFGQSDIKTVTVTIRNPAGDASATGAAQVGLGRYLFMWNYSKGQSPGNYNVTVSVVDQQDHAYNTTVIVTMLRYAVYVSSPQQAADEVIKGAASPPKGGGQGKDAVYSLLVLNSGYSPTSVTMRVSSEPPAIWMATLSTTSVASINPGAIANVTFTVIPSSDVDFGTRVVIYVEAVADQDTRMPKASWTVQTVTNATMSRTLDFSLNGQSDIPVDLGQKATYQMLARNKGLLDMNVTFSVSGTPVGWSARFIDVTGMVHLDTGQNAERTVTLEVTAPAEEVANISRIAQLTVTAQVLEDSSLERRITTITRLITILGLSMDKTVQTCDPGGKVDFRATISNMDPLTSHPIRITVTPPSDWPLTSVSFSPRETLLSPNSTTTIIITIMPPATAEANLDSGYTLTIKAEPTDQPTRSNSTAIVVKLRANIDFSIELSSSGRDATPGQMITLQLTVKNLGNSYITVVIFVAADIPQDWKVHLKFGVTDVLSPPNPLNVALAPKGRANDTQIVNLTVQPSKASRRDSTVKLTITATAGTDLKKSSAAQITVKKSPLDALIDAVYDSALVIVFAILVLLVFGVLLRRNARPARR